MNVRLTVNGEAREVPDALSAAELVEQLGLRREAVVVERNEEVIPRPLLDQVKLAEGDTIEIIQMIAGG